MSCQIHGDRSGDPLMSQASLWLYALAQGLGVLALNIALRVLVS